jgi:DNA-directed RNA polymerase specialized sigma24 family protein
VPLRRIRTPNLDPGTRATDKGNMVEVLTGLPRRDRDALLSFYCDGKSEQEIEATLGAGLERLQDLRHSAKTAFSERRSRRAVA